MNFTSDPDVILRALDSGDEPPSAQRMYPRQ